MSPRRFMMPGLGTLAALLGLVFAHPMRAQGPVGTAFSYQGELRNAAGVVNGTADFQFRLYANAAGGAELGPQVQTLSVTLINGRFTQTLDFGVQFAGAARFLEIDVRSPAGGGAFTTLSPRQTLSPAPYAIQSLSPGPVGAAGAVGPHGATGATGSTGPAGSPGAIGSLGAHGSTGTTGPTGGTGMAGPQGAVGSIGAGGHSGTTGGTGPTGLSGSQGALGAAGAAGAAAHVPMGQAQGFAGAPSTNSIAFIGPTTQVAVGSVSQRIFVSTAVVLGSSGGADGLNLFIGYQASGGAVTTAGLGALGLTCPAGQVETYCQSLVLSGLAPGTYSVGMAGTSTTSGAAWNSAGWCVVTYIMSDQ